MKKIILIKLGGSLISDKTKINKPRLNIIDNLSKQIKEITKKEKNLSLILATGAGGFGHPLADKYKNNLEKGWQSIRAAVKKLNQITVSSLIGYGVPAISISPFLISSAKIDRVINFLEAGKIPVFHADLLKDKQGKIFVLSMDKFLVDLAIFLKKKGLKIEKVVFAGTTAGVVSRVGRTIQKITKKDYPDLEKAFYKGKGIDVTGGMRYKVGQCLKLAKSNIASLIINGEKKDSLRQAISDRKVEGTIIRA